MSLFKRFLRPALFKLDAEQSHYLSIQALKSGLATSPDRNRYSSLETNLFGLSFPGPIGLAAGYDKNGDVPHALQKLGFGFVEVGTLTPRPQQGNPKPRIFRLPANHGVINRLGFNNCGHAEALKNLRRVGSKSGIIGVNIGANKDSDDFVADYETGLSALWEVADYFTANISSPNTPGLRDLQKKNALKNMLSRLLARRDELASEHGYTRPVLIKIAPDISHREISDIASAVMDSAIDGLVISNTTIDRGNLNSETQSSQSGGLSGKPLFEKSTIVLAKMRKILGPDVPIIGVGGIDGVHSAIEKLEAGADLLQLYTGMIYEGPGLISRINHGLNAHLISTGKQNISELTGTRVEEWAVKSI